MIEIEKGPGLASKESRSGPILSIDKILLILKNREFTFAETLPYKTANFFHCVQIAPLFERIQPNTSHKTEAGSNSK